MHSPLPIRRNLELLAGRSLICELSQERVRDPLSSAWVLLEGNQIISGTDDAALRFFFIYRLQGGFLADVQLGEVFEFVMAG